MTNPYKFMDLPPINGCPFCFSSNVSTNASSTTESWIGCDDCGADGPMCNSATRAIEKWNGPTNDIDALRKDCERLRRELDECNGEIR